MGCIDYLETKGFLTVAHHKPTRVYYNLICITSTGVKEIEKSPLDVQLHKRGLDLQLNAKSQTSKLYQDIQVFISYAKEDFEKTLKLYNNLKNEQGLNPSIDEESLLPGQKWNCAIIDRRN